MCKRCKPGYLHTKACGQKFYKALQGDGYEFRRKISSSSSTPGTEEYDVVPKSQEEEDADFFEKFVQADPDYAHVRKAEEAAKEKQT